MSDKYAELREALASGNAKLQHFAVAETEGLRWMAGRGLPDGLHCIELYGVPGGGNMAGTVAIPEKAIAALLAERDALKEALRHLYHNAHKSGADMGLALDVARAALGEKP